MKRVVARLAGALLLTAATPATGLAAIAGRVTSEAGTPVERARVEALPGGPATVTDPLGRFALPEVEPPVELLVTHPRFVEARRTVAAGATGPVEVTLATKLEIYEEIVVSATPGETAFAPVSVAATTMRPDEAVVDPTTVLELVEDAPGVAANGQGGFFQVYSVRGVSRFRVLTLVSGMQIVSERRAGVSLSFIDPLLLATVDVVRGPASTYHGSGALGGVVQAFPREFEGPWAAAGYRRQGDESYQTVGWGAAGFSLGLAHRRAGNAETAAGEELDSRFEALSATIRKEWELGAERSLEVLLIPTSTEDIGKASTDFPDRVTTYPEERHLLARLTLRGGDLWSLEAWAHPNELETEVVEPGIRRNEVANEAFDFGASGKRRWIHGPELASRFGFDYFGRRGVDAIEIDRDLRDPGRPGAAPIRRATLDDGEQDEAGLYGALEWSVARATLLGGARLSWQRQANGGRGRVEDTAWNGFLGAVVPLAPSLEATANVGTGQRFPSLSERFFSGTTGRGGVIGNPALASERSLDGDVGLRWYGDRLYLAGYLFRNRIEDYIERVEIAPDLFTYVNLISGTLAGAELEGLVRLAGRWQLSWGGHLVEGEDDDGAPLADVPPARFELEASFEEGPWRAAAEWERRFDKGDPGSGEKAIPAADLVGLSLAYRLASGLELRVTAANLLDELYFGSADEKVPHAPGRSIGVGMSWAPPQGS